MGVFKWLRRERVTLTSRRTLTEDHDVIAPSSPHSLSENAIGTIRTEDYKRDLAEFQARRSFGGRELPDTPTKIRCGKHSISVSCTDCATPDRDNTFNYEKKSATKYKKNKTHQRSHSASQDIYDAAPNVQFLFQNQVFMPGNVFQQPVYSEPYKTKTHSRDKNNRRSAIEENYAPKNLEFDRQNGGQSPKQDGGNYSAKNLEYRQDGIISPPFFYKNNSLPVDAMNFLKGCKSDEVDGELEETRPNSSSNKDDSCGRKLAEVMQELNSLDKWADEQLIGQSTFSSNLEHNNVDDAKSEASANGLPIVTASDLDVTIDRNRTWNVGKWGAVPVQMKRLTGVSVEHLRKKINIEVNILRKCRHPNIILLMAVFPDVYRNVYIVCERCVDSLFAIIHVQGRILSAQTSVQYASDIANALVFLRMRGFLHTSLTSHSVMLTDRGTAKLADFGPCAVLPQTKNIEEYPDKGYCMQNQYVNIGGARASNGDCEPLLSQNPSSVYLSTNAVAKDYKTYAQSEQYRWQAPELFEQDESGLVHVCSKSDVYSLSLLLWESCNASVPWKNMPYDKLKELYILWRTGLRLPHDGTYPGCLLELLQQGLTLARADRPDLHTFAERLRKVKHNLENMEYIVIPARLNRKQSDFSSKAWDSTPSSSDSHSPPANKAYHQPVNAQVHRPSNSSSSSKSDAIYETILSDLPRANNPDRYFVENDDKIFDDKINDDENLDDDDDGYGLTLKYENMKARNFSSGCSTPIKAKAKIIDVADVALQKSDSLYCSIVSQERSPNLSYVRNLANGRGTQSGESGKQNIQNGIQSVQSGIQFGQSGIQSGQSGIQFGQSGIQSGQSGIHFGQSEIQTGQTGIQSAQSGKENSAKLITSFTPKSYKPLHIKVPEFNNNMDDVKSLPKDLSDCGKPSYTFDVRNSSLPNTPIARSNKLRKNAWLSGELEAAGNAVEVKMLEELDKLPAKEVKSTPSVRVVSNKYATVERSHSLNDSAKSSTTQVRTPEGVDVVPNICQTRESEVTNNTPPSSGRDRTHSWSFRSTERSPRKASVETEELAGVNVKPLVAIHERWIHEANKKSALASSSTEANRNSIPAVKPASHCDSIQSSLSSSNGKRGGSKYLMNGGFPANRNGRSEQYNAARDNIARSITFSHRDRKTNDTSTTSIPQTTQKQPDPKPKVDQTTDTESIEHFIRDLIKKEFQHLLHDISTEESRDGCRKEDVLSRGIQNVIDSLAQCDQGKLGTSRSFSKVKINGNNKPLLQITFNRGGENSLHVLDKSVNVTISDKKSPNVEEALNESGLSMKRCQGVGSLQEARSTEDLYIDDDLSTQMQENFGGKVKLIPLHGSLHEILCEKEDDCCLIKVKQENGCDTIYFRCDNSDTESRDAIDGATEETVVYKRSISLVEEKIHRVPKKKPILATRRVITNIEDHAIKKDTCKQDSSEKNLVKNTALKNFEPPFARRFNNKMRLLSISSPTLNTLENEVEMNIEQAICYEDSSSDECVKTTDDEFEYIEKEIERSVAESSGECHFRYLEKISEESFSVIDDAQENQMVVDYDSKTI